MRNCKVVIAAACFGVLSAAAGVRSERAEVRAGLADPAKFESTLAAALRSDDEWVRRYALCELWQKSPDRARELGRGMTGDPSDLVKAFLVDIGSIVKKDDFKFYRDNVAPSQDPNEDHDYSVLQRFPLAKEDWAFLTDPKNAGHKLAKPYFAADLDDSAWGRIKVTSHWEAQGVGDYDGYAWYRLRFTLPERPQGGKSVELCFGAVDEDAWVWLNGEYVGQKVEGEAAWDRPFRFNAEKELRWGAENVIAVRVFDSAKGGGIWRPITVEVMK